MSLLARVRRIITGAPQRTALPELHPADDPNPYALPAHVERKPKRSFAPRSDQPIGQTQAFVERVAEMKGQPFVRAWLSNRTCQFEDNAIWTHDLGRKRLYRELSQTMRQFSVIVQTDERARAHFRAKNPERGRGR